MPYKLKKAPKRDLYWVVNKNSGKKHSIDPLPYEKAQRQLNLLRAIDHGFIPDKNYKLSGGFVDEGCVMYTGRYSSSHNNSIFSPRKFIQLCKQFPELSGNNHTLDECLAFTGAHYYFSCSAIPDPNNTFEVSEEDINEMFGKPVGYLFSYPEQEKIFIYLE
jgi:hypothetical protein